MNNEICNKVEELYTSSIYPVCPKRQLCDNNSCFKLSEKPKMPYIGREYGNNPEIPNLMFISLDSGIEHPDTHTVKEVRESVESHPPRLDLDSGNDVGKHWYQTFDIASYILDSYINDSIKNDVTFIDKFIVHTNSAKCTQNKPRKELADNNLFINCRDFVLQEIALLNAQVIISQGNQAQDCLNRFPLVEKKILKTIHNEKNIELPIFIRKINNNNVLHIPMYHQSYYKGYWGQKKALLDNLDEVRLIIRQIQLE